MDASISAQLHDLVTGLYPLQSLNNLLLLQPEFLGALLASSVALGIAIFGERIRRLWIKTTLEATEVYKTIQSGGGLVLYRLLLINKGNHKAQDVEVIVENFYGGDGKMRGNFLPVPLEWTHSHAYMKSKIVRDIHPKQPVHLDLLEFIPSQRQGQGYTDASLKLRAGAGNELPDSTAIDAGQSSLLLKAYQADGKPLRIKLKIKWDGKELPIIKLI